MFRRYLNIAGLVGQRKSPLISSVYCLNSFSFGFDHWLSTVLEKPMVIQVCVFLNLLGFLGWYVHPELMLKHALNSKANLTAGRYWNLITNIFSEFNPIMLYMNLKNLMALGPLLINALGLRSFFVSFLISGLFGSLAPHICNYFTSKYFPENGQSKERLQRIDYLGFSGVSCGLLAQSMIMVHLVLPDFQWLQSDLLAFSNKQTTNVKWN